MAWVNKYGGSPRGFSHSKMKIYLMPVHIDLARVSSFERLCRGTPLHVLCLEIARSDGIWQCAPVFFSDCLVWFQRESCEALLSVVIMGHVFEFNGQVRDGECHGS
jgi:hypothetical protein